MIISLLSFSLAQIGILTGLSILVVTIVGFDIAVGVSIKRQKQPSPQQTVSVAAPVEPDAAAEPVAEPLPVIIAAPVAVSDEAVEAAYERIRLVRSYLAKLIQTTDDTKQLYNELKNELLAYNGVKDRISWKWESFRNKKTAVAHIGVRGKTLCLYLALDPQTVGDKYKVEDMGNLSSCEETPLLYRIKNPLRMRYAKELIAQMMSQLGIERAERDSEDYTAGLEYRSTPALIEEGLIRVPEGVKLPTFAEIAAATAPESTEALEEPVISPLPEVFEEPIISPLPEPIQEPVIMVKADITPEEEEILSRLKLDRSFTAKLVHTEEETKQLYAELKRELLSYTGVHTRISWRRETFSKSREALARFGVRGKTLCLYLALQPADFSESKYKAEDASGHSSFADTPLMYRIKNPLRMRYAKELIAILMTEHGLERAEYTGEDPMSGLEYRSTPMLIDEGLIRVPSGMELPVFTESVQEAAAVEEAQPIVEEPQTEVVEEAQPVEEQADEPTEEPPVELTVEQAEEPAEQAEEATLSAEEPSIIEEAPFGTIEEIQSIVEEPQPVIEESEEVIEEPQFVEEEAQPIVEELQTEVVEEAQPVAEQYEPSEEPPVELTVEQAEEPVEREIPVVGVVFRRRSKKIYWFDPDGKEWQKDEVAIYTTADGTKIEVVVVEVTKRAESLLHLPLKALEKLNG